jgi:hypothetical protein
MSVARVGLRFVRAPRLGEAHARHVEAVFDVIEQAPREHLDQPPLLEQRVRRHRVPLDPATVVVDAPPTFDLAFGSVSD